MDLGQIHGLSLIVLTNSEPSGVFQQKTNIIGSKYFFFRNSLLKKNAHIHNLAPNHNFT